VYDKGDRCSPGEKVDKAGYCVCPKDTVPVYRDVILPTGSAQNPLVREACVPCGEHEVAQGEVCACAEGYARTAEGEPCVEAAAPPVNYGAACTSDADCSGSDEATCILDDMLGGTLRAGYCSARGCESSAACPTDQGYGCYPGASGGFCRMPPSGEGDACDASEGDASNPACTMEATTCAFARCTSPEVCDGNESCTPGLVCCDLSSFRPGAFICTTTEACITD
jgi:hypothetical protein